MQIFDAQNFRPRMLAIYLYYRLALILILLISFQWLYPTLAAEGQVDALQFYVLLGVYTLITALSWLATWGLRLDLYANTAILMLDVLLLSGLAYITGPAGGLHTLVLVPIALSGILLTLRLSLLIAATATTISVYTAILLDTANAPQAATLGVIQFATVLLINFLRVRLGHTEAIAIAQRGDIEELQQLNQLVIERLRTPIVVTTTTGQIKLRNESALDMGLAQALLPPVILTALNDWLNSDQQPKGDLSINQDFPTVKVSFRYLTESQPSDVLIFMEDTRVVAQQAQQLKLASLGRLTASIAHEVRNPLSAIRHAEQLLAEADYLTPPDRQLLTMIERNCQRVDGIIANVLQLGRRSESDMAQLNLNHYLTSLTSEYQSRHPEVTLTYRDEMDLTVRFDHSQLRQIITNLLDNAIRHSGPNKQVEVIAGEVAATKQPFIDVIDSGPGPNAAVQAQLFEPFFTTEPGGTGLGLYLCRELAIANQAELSCIDDGQGHFRLLFSHPSRR